MPPSMKVDHWRRPQDFITEKVSVYFKWSFVIVIEKLLLLNENVDITKK